MTGRGQIAQRHRDQIAVTANGFAEKYVKYRGRCGEENEKDCD